jgi:hypothetical protein
MVVVCDGGGGEWRETEVVITMGVLVETLVASVQALLRLLLRDST